MRFVASNTTVALSVCRIEQVIQRRVKQSVHPDKLNTLDGTVMCYELQRLWLSGLQQERKLYHKEDGTVTGRYASTYIGTYCDLLRKMLGRKCEAKNEEGI